MGEPLISRRLRVYYPFGGWCGRGGNTPRRAPLRWRQDRRRVLRAGGVDPHPVRIVVPARRVLRVLVDRGIGRVIHRIWVRVSGREEREEPPKPYVEEEHVPMERTMDKEVIRHNHSIRHEAAIHHDRVVKAGEVGEATVKPLSKSTMETMPNSTVEATSKSAAEPTAASAAKGTAHPRFSRWKVNHRENHTEQGDRHSDQSPSS